MGHRRAGYREGVRRVTEESERCQNAYRKFSGSCGWSPYVGEDPGVGIVGRRVVRLVRNDGVKVSAKLC